MVAAPMFPSEDDSLTTHFLRIATSQPQSVAVLSSKGQLSYEELLRRAIVVAQALRGHGVARGVLVGIVLPRSVESLLAVLGTLLAGGAYVPIDPDYPVERQRFLLADSEVSVVVTATSMVPPLLELTGSVVDLDTLAGQSPATDFAATESCADDLLYVLYTSGSTGRPNGVCGSHRATLNRLRWGVAAFPFAEGGAEVVAHRSSLNFVDSVAEIFSGLLSGVPTALLEPSEVNDLGKLLASLRRFGVSRLTVVPSVLAALLRTVPNLEQALPQLTLWTCSGEELPLSLLRQFRAAHPSATMLNIYGSTEVTADVTCAVFPPHLPLPEERVPIGSSMAGAELLILDEQMQPVPDGQSGELYVGGPVLSQGYLRRPTEQSRRFVAHPQRPGERLFRTGDRVRRDGLGQMYFLGRQDHQVKLRGVRVELEEIERTLLGACPWLRELAVIVKEEPEQPLSRRLLAFFSPPDLDVSMLRAAAQRLLPMSMLPAEYLAIATLPLLPNGKLDRRTLTELAQRTTRVLQPSEAPLTDTERRLAALFASVLSVSPIARQDSFADLGGNSLALAELLVAIGRDFHGDRLESLQVARLPLHVIASWIDGDKKSVLDLPPQLGFELLPLSASGLTEEQTIRLAAEMDADREPLTAATALTVEDDLPFVTPIVQASWADGLSFVAREKGGEPVLGICLAHDFCSLAVIPVETAPVRLLPSLELLTELEHEFIQKYGEPSRGEVVQLSLTGTIPGVPGYEMTRELELQSLAAARQRGYRFAMTICTHRVTAIQAERAGFTRLSSREYSTYEFEGQRVFASLANVHREAILFVKELT